MEEKFLPIGTVVLLKGADKNVMITNYYIFSKDSKDKIFEYGGCPFPDGAKMDMALGFNHEDIEKVVFMGYVNEEQKELSNYLIENAEDIKKTIRES